MIASLTPLSTIYYFRRWVHCLFDVLVSGVVVLGRVARVVAAFGVLFKRGVEGGTKCIFIEESIGLASTLTAYVKTTVF